MRCTPTSFTQIIAAFSATETAVALRLFDFEFKGVHETWRDVPAAAEYPHLTAATFVHHFIVFFDLVAVGPASETISVFKSYVVGTRSEVLRNLHVAASRKAALRNFGLVHM